MELKIGETILRLRRERGLTQEQLAAAVGVSPPAVSKWERGVSHN
ncbi:helix-turn-helix domain-containing protein [Bittarella massiliensis]|nr:helix-turn-helix domain-containing protein [Bittarella massiliensis (ex Durand et al. 2017)]